MTRSGSIFYFFTSSHPLPPFSHRPPSGPTRLPCGRPRTRPCGAERARKRDFQVTVLCFFAPGSEKHTGEVSRPETTNRDRWGPVPPISSHTPHHHLSSITTKKKDRLAAPHKGGGGLLAGRGGITPLPVSPPPPLSARSRLGFPFPKDHRKKTVPARGITDRVATGVW